MAIVIILLHVPVTECLLLHCIFMSASCDQPSCVYAHADGGVIVIGSYTSHISVRVHHACCYVDGQKSALSTYIIL